MVKIIFLLLTILPFIANAQTKYIGQTKEYLIKEHSSCHINHNDSDAIAFNCDGYKSIFMLDNKSSLSRVAYQECPSLYKDTLVKIFLSQGYVRETKLTKVLMYYNDDYSIWISDVDIEGKPSLDKVTVLYTIINK